MVAFTRSRPLAFSMHFLRPISVAREKPDIPLCLSLFLSLVLCPSFSRTPSFSLVSPFSFSYRQFLSLSDAYPRSLCNSKDIRSLRECLQSRLRARNHFPGGLCTEFHARRISIQISSTSSQKSLGHLLEQNISVMYLDKSQPLHANLIIFSNLTWICIRILRIH